TLLGPHSSPGHIARHARIKPQRLRILPRGANLDFVKANMEQLSVDNLQIQEPGDIDNAISFFMRQINQAAAIAAPRNRLNDEGPRPLQLPPRIGALLNLKRRVRREYARTGDARILQIHSRLANCLRKALARSKQEAIDNFLQKLDPEASSNYSLWRITKRYKTQATPKSAIKNTSGGWCRTSLKKAEVFASNLELRFKPYEYSPESIRQQVDEFLGSPFQMSLPANPVTLAEVKVLVNKLSPKKTPGKDLLDNRTIRLLPDQALQFLVPIFNSVLTVGYYSC
ncbi:hypothetical protein KR018_000833, partial [Drosophila ironensis]